MNIDCGGRKVIGEFKADLTLYATRGRTYKVNIEYGNNLIGSYTIDPDNINQVEYWEDILHCEFPKSQSAKNVIFNTWED